MSRNAVRATWPIVLSVACGGAPAQIDSIATFNVGTTPFLDIVGASNVRETCALQYDNNLCTLESEDLAAAALMKADPDIIFFQEVWDVRRCDGIGPEEGGRAPFVCAREGHQLERILPAGHHYACAPAHPDNCIAFDPDVFEVDGECEARDCSRLVQDGMPPCAAPGRFAWLRGEGAEGAMWLVVMHANAGFSDDNRRCRAEDVEALRTVLESGPEVFVVGGDFNFDPVVDAEEPDASAFAHFTTELGARRASDRGDTHWLTERDFDLVVTRGLPKSFRCDVLRVDETLSAPMFDHALVSCR